MIKQYIGGKLTRQLALVVLIAFAASCVLYFASAYVLEEAVCAYYERHPEIVRQKASAKIDELQAYATSAQITAMDRTKLSAWVSGNPLMVLQIHQDNRLVFDSTAQSNAALHTHLAEHSPSTTQLMRTVDFAGGSAQVSIAVFPEHALVDGLSKGLLVFCCALFLGITLLGIRRKIRYLVRLEQEVLAIAGGDLALPITSHGTDELAMLAGCIDEMRHSLIERLKQEENRQQERHAWITSLSHDLRTPLTSLNGYLEVLGRRPLPEAESRYVEKCIEKTGQLRQMTDTLFSSFTPGATLAETAVTVSADGLVRDYLAAQIDILRESGFHVDIPELARPNLMLSVQPTAVARVFGNVCANIARYADPTAAATITFPEDDPTGLAIRLQSTTNHTEQMHGTGLGLSICANLMDNMKGHFRVEAPQDSFVYHLFFPGEDYKSSRK